MNKKTVAFCFVKELSKGHKTWLLKMNQKSSTALIGLKTFTKLAQIQAPTANVELKEIQDPVYGKLWYATF